MKYYRSDVKEVTEKSCQIKPWKLFEKMQFYFFFADFENFLPSHSILLTFGVELMLPKGGQILVDDFRHQNLEFGFFWAVHFSKKWPKWP